LFVFVSVIAKDLVHHRFGFCKTCSRSNQFVILD
jgi:hypothetical protein